jgi:hypothetical protein
MHILGQRVSLSLESAGPNFCKEWLHAFAGKMECGCVRAKSATEVPPKRPHLAFFPMRVAVASGLADLRHAPPGVPAVQNGWRNNSLKFLLSDN